MGGKEQLVPAVHLESVRFSYQSSAEILENVDLPSVERIDTAIAEFPGAILIVSHDERFARRTTDSEWRIGGGAVTAGSE
jgi:ATPase subunit of ABC transporter with duplicated ATPase domains